MSFGDIWRLGASQNLAVNSAAGAATSTALFGTETYAVQLNFPGSTSSTGGVRVAFGNAAEGPVANSTSALLSANYPFIVKVTPGQRLSAISNDAGTPSLNIVQLTK